MNPRNNQQTSQHWVIIPAAGVGARMQANRPKQYLSLGSSCILQHTLEIFLADLRFNSVAVGTSIDDAYYNENVSVESERLIRFTGGKERVDTVLNGLSALRNKAHAADWVWVHDAARPCLSSDDIEKLFELVTAVDTDSESRVSGALLAAPLVDTIKYSTDGCCIDHSVDRNKLWRAFTPQVFRFNALELALQDALKQNMAVTDESSAIEAAGGVVKIIQGSEDNIKITRPGDLELAKQFLAKTKAD